MPRSTTIRSIRFRDIQLLDLTRIVCDLANLKFVVEPRQVVVIPKANTYGMILETRAYRIPNFNLESRNEPKWEIRTYPDGPDLASPRQVVIEKEKPLNEMTRAELISELRLALAGPIRIDRVFPPEIHVVLITSQAARLERAEELLKRLDAGFSRLDLADLKNDPRFAKQLDDLNKKLKELDDFKKKVGDGEVEDEK